MRPAPASIRTIRAAASTAAVVALGLGLGLGLVWPGVGQAQTPAVGCEVSDFSMAMQLWLPLAGDGSGSPATQPMQGTLELRHQKIPQERRRWTLDGRKPAQFWNRNGELKILLLLGTGEGRISLAIETSSRHGSGEHSGQFRLETADVKLTGRLACAVG